MKLITKRLFIITLFFLILSNLYSIDLYTYASTSNFNFNSENIFLSSDYQFEFGEVVTQNISENLFLIAGFKKEIINDYSVFTNFSIKEDLFGFNLGIFTSFLNSSSKILTPGLNYGLEFIFPGFILISLDLQNTIPNTAPLENGININNYSFRLGFYLGEAIISGNYVSQNNSAGSIVSTTSTTNDQYYINLDMFNKYSRYRISIDLGWNYLNRTVKNLVNENSTLSGNITVEKSAGSGFFNGKFTILLMNNIDVELGFLIHLFKFPIKDVSSFPSNEFSWGCNLGLKINL